MNTFLASLFIVYQDIIVLVLSLCNHWVNLSLLHVNTVVIQITHDTCSTHTANAHYTHGLHLIAILIIYIQCINNLVTQ